MDKTLKLGLLFILSIAVHAQSILPAIMQPQPAVSSIVRGTTSTYTTAAPNPINIPIPAGSVAGDFYIIQAAGYASVSNCEGGTTILYQDSGMNYVNGFACSGSLTSTDITQGYVQMNPGTNSDLIVYLTDFVGAHTVQNTYHSQSGTGSFTSPVSGPAATITSPATGMYFTVSRGTAASTNTVSLGTLTQQGSISDSTLSGVLNAHAVTSSGSYTPSFSYSVPGNGYAISEVIVQ